LASGQRQVPAVFYRPDHAAVIVAPVNAYSPQQQYGWIPPVFSDRPPADSVYMYGAPPPYPGINQDQQPQQQYGNVMPSAPVLPTYDDAVKMKKGT